MSMASTSRFIFNNTAKRRLAFLQLEPKSLPLASLVPGRVPQRAFVGTATSPFRYSFIDTLSSRRLPGTATYATSAYTQAQSNATNVGATKSGESSSSPTESNTEDKPDFDPDEPPKKASFREKLRFLSRRYGWWALAVYLLASVVDFSLVFAAIHMLGADHIRDLEDRFRKYIGMGKREMADHEAAAWPVPAGAGVLDNKREDDGHINNEEAAQVAAKRVKRQEDVAQVPGKSSKSSSSSGGNGTLWTEAVLAYTIHKTLLLPFRVGATAAITPSFVKYMVKLGWAKDNAAVQRAAHKVKMAREAAKAKAAQTTTKASP